jgi:hypothetical protein
VRSFVRRVPRVGFDEDWGLLLLGFVVIVATLGAAVLAASTAHDRGRALADAATRTHRLTVAQSAVDDGLDGKLYQDLIDLQQAEIQLFQDQVDTPAQEPPSVTGENDPQLSLTAVHADLDTITASFSGSAGVQVDVTKITRELAVYTGLVATAQADHEQGLPVGGAYLREASEYLTANTLPVADDIRTVDQEGVAADDRVAGGLPVLSEVVSTLALVSLVGVQVVVARYTRRTFNRGLVLATAAIVVLTAGSLTLLALSASEVSDRTTPHGVAAAALARARIDAKTANTYDLLTLAAHDEDCVDKSADPAKLEMTCSYEAKVLTSLGVTSDTASQASETPAPNNLMDDLTSALRATSGSPEAEKVTEAKGHITGKDGWATEEKSLPTLQNLEMLAGDAYPRYDCQSLQHLRPYATPPPTESDTKQCTITAPDEDPTQASFNAVDTALTNATASEWDSHQRHAEDAQRLLTALVPGTLLLGLLAAVAGAIGVGRRVAEYWSAGDQA